MAIVDQLRTELKAQYGVDLKWSVYDVNKEWGAPGPLPTMDKYLETATRSRDMLFVFEEATLFFDPTQGRSDELRELLVRRRHTGVALILLFHAIADVPRYVLRMVDTWIQYKTNDADDDLRRVKGFRALVNAYRQVMADPDPHASVEFDFNAAR